MATIAAIEVEPSGGPIGAEIQGVDLRRDLEDAAVARIERALVEHKVIVFRDQHISTEEHLAFARRFGALELHPFQDFFDNLVTFKPGYPEVLVLESKPGKVAVAEVWHSDVTWRREPSLGSVLRITDVPESGGDTMWADMAAAYDGLDDATRSHLSGLTAIHDWEGFRRGIVRAGAPQAKIDELNALYPLVEHPVVRTHPVSGRKAIYVNANFTTAIKGMAPAESDALLQRLYGLADDPQIQFRLAWRPGTVVFWDNRSTQHRVNTDVVGHRRMERVTVAGSPPF